MFQEFQLSAVEFSHFMITPPRDTAEKFNMDTYYITT